MNFISRMLVLMLTGIIVDFPVASQPFSSFEARLHFEKDNLEYWLENSESPFPEDIGYYLRKNNVSSLNIRHADQSNAYFYRFDASGRITMIAACLAQRTNSNWIDSMQTVTSEDGSQYINHRADHGWGIMNIVYPDSNKVLRIMHSYWNGVLEGVDSSINFLCANTTAESGISWVTDRYRTGKVLQEQQQFFNERYYNHPYPDTGIGSWVRQYDWEPSKDFCTAYGTTDSLYFTKELNARYVYDSLYHTFSTISYTDRDAFRKNRLQWPVFVEPVIRYRIPERTLTCGYGIRNIAEDIPATIYLSNGLPSASGFRGFNADKSIRPEYLYEYTYFDDGNADR